jgi:hypothetical protein
MIILLTVWITEMSAVTGPRVTVDQQWRRFVSMKVTAREFSPRSQESGLPHRRANDLVQTPPNGRWREFAKSIMKGNSTVFGPEARTVAICYGRSGQGGQEKRFASPKAEEVRAIVRERLRRRLSAPNRIGCPYRLTMLNSAPGVDASAWLPREAMAKFFQAA